MGQRAAVALELVHHESGDISLAARHTAVAVQSAAAAFWDRCFAPAWIAAEDDVRMLFRRAGGVPGDTGRRSSSSWRLALTTEAFVPGRWFHPGVVRL